MRVYRQEALALQVPSDESMEDAINIFFSFLEILHRRRRKDMQASCTSFGQRER